MLFSEYCELAMYIIAIFSSVNKKTFLGLANCIGTYTKVNGK